MVSTLSIESNAGGKSPLALSLLVAGLLLVAVLLAGCAQASEPAKPASSGALSAPAAPVTSPSGEVAMSDNKTGYEKNQTAIVNAIADGTYSEPVFYMSPGGQDEVNISISVKDDVITAVSLKAVKGDETSSRYMANYNKNIQPLAVGKKISELNLPKNVAGSSLTNGAFKQYVADIIAKY